VNITKSFGEQPSPALNRSISSSPHICGILMSMIPISG